MISTASGGLVNLMGGEGGYKLVRGVVWGRWDESEKRNEGRRKRRGEERKEERIDETASLLSCPGLVWSGLIR